jgi:cell division protein FtsI (penicillin-binding protein 3)
MAGARRKKRPAGSSGSRRGSRNGMRGGASSRSAPTGSRERRKSSKARVIQFPQGRQPKRSRTPNRRKAGSAGGRGRVRLIVGAVVVVCVLLSLEGRAVQLSVAKDDHYQAFTTEAYAEESPDAATSGESTGRGSIVSADGRYLAMSLDTVKVIATPYQVEEPEEAAEALSGVLGEDAGTAAEIEEKLAAKNDEDGPSGYSVVAEDIEP